MSVPAALRDAIVFVAIVAAHAAAQAHDSWFVQGEGGKLTIGTGLRYPLAELVDPESSIARRACNEGSCWAELRELQIDLDPKLVDVYFRDAHPSAAVRERWRLLHSQGIGWHERYRKFMRIELASTPDRAPAGLDLEFVALGDSVMIAGGKARFVLMSQGKPVADQPVELVSERNPLGIWSRTNSQGEVEWPLPFAGRWLARTILIEPDGATDWKSRFATLVFEAR